MEIRVPITKLEEERQMAFGFANVFRTTEGDEIVDSHDDTIDTEEAIAAIEDAVYRYVLDSRSGDEQHINYGVARLVESIVLTAEKREAFALHAMAMAIEGGDERPPPQILTEKMAAAELVLPDAWWTGFKIDDANVWAKVKDGTYKMFSIVGRGRRNEIDE